MSMNHSDFHIGLNFFMSGQKWLCTDVGSRVVVAIHLDPNLDPTWFHGPPYAVDETTIDEYDFPACFLSESEDV